MIKLLTRLLLISTLAISYLAHAKDFDDYYIVEMIVFTNELRMYQHEENWPNQEQLSVEYPLYFLEEQAIDVIYPEVNGGRSLSETQSSLPLLSSNHAELSDAAGKIRSAGRHRLLSHQVWLQKLTPPEQAQAIAIQAGRSINSHHEVAGSITLSKNRYLHIDANLWRAIFTNDEEEAADIVLPEINRELNKPADEDEISEELDVFEQLLEEDVYDEQPWVKIVSSLKQKRRMRSQEIHFLDHPLFGVIIQLRPYISQ